MTKPHDVNRDFALAEWARANPKEAAEALAKAARSCTTAQFSDFLASCAEALGFKWNAPT